MTIAVTGASGFLGSYVVEAFAHAGHDVVGVIRNAARSDEVRGFGAREVRLADLDDPAALTRAFTGCHTVVLVAALAVRRNPPWEDWLRANVTGVENAMHAAAAAGVRRVVYVSTVAVHRILVPWRVVGLDTPRLDEVHVPWSLHFLGTRRKYSVSKALGEGRALALAASLGLSLTVLRPGPVYGARDPKTTSWYRSLLERRLVVLPSTPIPHVHAGDVASCCVRAVENPEAAGRAYFVTGPSVSLPTLVHTLGRLAGRGPRILTVPTPLGLRYDDGPAVRDLGFRARPLEDGLREVLAFPPPR